MEKQKQNSPGKPKSKNNKKQTQNSGNKQNADTNNAKNNRHKKMNLRKKINVQSTKKGAKKHKENLAGLRVIPLGGLNEIGKNLTVLEYENDMMIIDCGLSFPDDEMFGIDIVIPDFSYLIKNKNKIKGMIITHGHEDHIGGIPYLLQKIDIPIYATKLTSGLIESKLEEHKIKGRLNIIEPGDIIGIGPFKAEAIRTTHSVADSICLAIDTPVGKLFHTGDFKIDYTPIDSEPIDFQRLADIGEKGVLLMLSDSTNAERSGYTPSEKKVGMVIENIFRGSKARIIIATFASNVHRVQKIIDAAVSQGRKVAISGRSMERVMNIAIELGYIKVPAGTIVDLNETKNIPDKKLVIITTGSQGEPMSALVRMATKQHKSVKIKKGDMVILSSSPVPGNEKTVSDVVNLLFEEGADVIYSDIADIHVSGHARAEELKLMLSLIKPKYFMPVHGEYRHLHQHAMLAEEIGINKNNVFILENGQILDITKTKAFVSEKSVTAEAVLVDGLGVGDVGNVVLNDRKLLSESGLILAVTAIDPNGQIVSGPEIISRGFVYVKENIDLINESKEVVLNSLSRTNSKDFNSMKNAVREDLRGFIYKKTKRSPVILPVFLEV